MKKEQVDIQVDSQVDYQDNSQDENKNDNIIESLKKNVTCNIFKEQFDLINELPEEERAKVLYIAVYSAFYENQKNQDDIQDDSQLDKQDEHTYISISLSISKYISKLSSISKSVLGVLLKTITCKNYNNNWGGKRTKKTEKPPKTPKSAEVINFDLYDPKIIKAIDIYKKECSALIPISFEKKDRKTLTLLAQVLDAIDNDVGKFTELCQKANDLIKIADTKIDFKMMLNCYIGILQGKYKEEEKSMFEGLDFNGGMKNA